MRRGLAQPVGNTSEASASMGGSGTLYSPFSPFYNPKLAQKIEQQTVRRMKMRTNPPITDAEEAAILAYQTSVDNKVVIPTYAVLAVGGCIVNREWSSAARLARKLETFARSKDKASSKASATTFGLVFSRIAQYCEAIAAGKDPVRTATSKEDLKKGVMISLWDDVAKCALAENGNVKLPFAAYSEMPIVTCPGAGGVAAKFAQLSGPALGAAVPSTGVDVRGCASFCYSLKAFRNPSVCYRLLVLTLGMAAHPEHHVDVVIAQMLRLHKKKGVKILRLFVDGDFRDVTAIALWMSGVKKLGEKGILVYGYSKSWEEFLSVDQHFGSAWWPSNYVLNISSGSRHAGNTSIMARMKALPISRDEFIAVDPMHRLTWKAFTKARGEKIWQSYIRRMNAIGNARGTKGAKESAGKALRQRLGQLIARANPDLAAAYNEYVETVHDLEADGSATLARVRNAIGEPTMVPGPIVQASTYAFLRTVADGELPCPISCGSCPGTAIPQHDKVIKAARLNDTEFLEKADVKGKILERKIASAKVGGTIHLCGNARAKRPIIIGLH